MIFFRWRRFTAPVRLAAGICLVAGASAAAAQTRALDHRSDLSQGEREKAAQVLAAPENFAAPEPFEDMPGGAATSRKRINRDAFSHPSANLSFEEQQTFRVGNGIFRKFWVSAPSSTQASDGLGPLYNARSCQGCHLKDGRGAPPAPGEPAVSLFLRLSVPPVTDEERQALANRQMATLPEPVYGGQFQTFAVPGLAPEGELRITYEDLPVALSGGETVVLQKPLYEAGNLAYGPMRPDTMISPRVAPQMIGLGLLEAIHPADLEALADPDDADGDGISGRLSLVRDPASGALVQGRFGWKATMPDVRAQSAAAFSGDIGISTPEHPDPYGDCTAAQTACRSLPTGEQDRLGKTEAPDPVMDLVTFYSENLAVPARRDMADPDVLRGKEVFYGTGCTSCHVPKYVTRKDAKNPAHSFQLIWPYTDLLLHDMGEGLADHRPDGDAGGREWRTAPLWGIGLTQTVSGHTRFLHDGRARSLLEAVLWHGGEAQAARDAVVAMPPEDRAALIRFLESL